MEYKNRSYPFIFFNIPAQINSSHSIIGSGGVSGGYDAQFNVSIQSLYFGFAVDGSYYDKIMFDGYKK